MSFLNGKFKKLKNKLKLQLSPPKLHIIGDSHCCALKEINFSSFTPLEISYCIVPGATISGIQNPNSKTQALPIFQDYINEQIRPKDYTIVQLGEVDCGFTIWYKAENHNLNAYDILNTVYFQLSF